MKTLQTKALVLREYDAGESDKRLLLLGKDCGKITVYARGAKKPKSKFMAASQLFTYGEFCLAEGRGFYSLTHGTVIESFFAVRESYDALVCGQYMLEVCAFLPNGTAMNELLYALLRALKVLAAGKLPAIQVLTVFLFRFYKFYGIAPGVSCGTCAAEPAVPGPGEFFFCCEGIICGSCAQYSKGDILRISGGTAAAVRHIIDSPDEVRAYSFTVSAAVLAELRKAAELYWLAHFDFLPKSHALLDL